MQLAVYFLNRMSKMKRGKRQRAGLWGNAGYMQRPGTDNAERVMNKSHGPWTFLWRHRCSDMELFHEMAQRLLRNVGISDPPKWRYCICGWYMGIDSSSDHTPVNLHSFCTNYHKVQSVVQSSVTSCRKLGMSTHLYHLQFSSLIMFLSCW